MTAKNKSLRFKRLISHGYFAPELPPCFVSNDLARYRKTIWESIEAVPPSRRGRPGGAKEFISEPSWFYFPRYGRNDRRHGVINPVSYLAIANTVSENFVDLRSSAKRSKITVSPLVFDWSGTRAVVRPKIDLRDNFRVQLSNRCNSLVVADVRAFFHSIYTHAIPWAVYGKTWAKRNRSNRHFGNLLDLYCRNAQDGQTIGLPVGPDTSRIIAEVVAAAVDVQLVSALGIRVGEASRYVDDYSVGVFNSKSGEEVISEIRRSVSRFELELNTDKSGEFSTSHRFSTGWKQAVLEYVPRTDFSEAAFSRFFYEVGRVCSEQPEINVEKYALQNARRAFARADDWSHIQGYLVSSYRRNPTLVSFITEVFLIRQVERGDVDLDALRLFLESHLDELARQDRSGEIIWLLFLAFRLGLELRASRISELFQLENAFVAFLVTFGRDSGRLVGQIDHGAWRGYLNQRGLQSPMWLYSYECLRLGIAPSGSDTILTGHPYFAKMYSRNVKFFDLERGFTSMNSTLSELRGENRTTARLREDFLEDFDFDLDDIEDWDEIDEFDDYDEEYD